MSNYLIKADEVTGVKGSRFFKNQIVSEENFIPSTIEDLISLNIISLIDVSKKYQKKEKPE